MRRAHSVCQCLATRQPATRLHLRSASSAVPPPSVNSSFLESLQSSSNPHAATYYSPTPSPKSLFLRGHASSRLSRHRAASFCRTFHSASLNLASRATQSPNLEKKRKTVKTSDPTTAPAPEEFTASTTTDVSNSYHANEDPRQRSELLNDSSEVSRSVGRGRKFRRGSALGSVSRIQATDETIAKAPPIAPNANHMSSEALEEVVVNHLSTIDDARQRPVETRVAAPAASLTEHGWVKSSQIQAQSLQLVSGYVGHEKFSPVRSSWRPKPGLYHLKRRAQDEEDQNLKNFIAEINSSPDSSSELTLREDNFAEDDLFSSEALRDSDSAMDSSQENNFLRGQKALDPDFSGFLKALELRDTAAAWLKYKDIIMIKEFRHLIEPVHVQALLQLFVFHKTSQYERMKLLIESARCAEIPVTIDHRNILIEACIRFADSAGAREQLGLIHSEGLKPNLTTYNLFLNLYGVKERNVDAAREFFGHMLEEGVQPDVKSYNILMSAAVLARRFDLVEEFRAEMGDMGISGNGRTYDILTQYKLASNDIDEALVVYQEGKRLGLIFSPVIATTLIKELGNQKRLDDARRIYEEFLETAAKRASDSTAAEASEGPDGEPSNKPESGVSRLLKIGSKDIQEQEKKLKKELQEKRKKVLKELQLSVDVGDEDENQGTAVRDMREDLSKPDVALHTAMITAHFKNGDIPGAVSTFENMINSGVAPDSHSFQRVVQGFCDAGCPREAEDVAVSMRAGGLEITPSIYATVIKAYLDTAGTGNDAGVSISNEGRLTRSLVRDAEGRNMGLSGQSGVADAVRLFEQMRAQHISPSTALYNELLRGLSRAFDMDLVSRYWKRWLAAVAHQAENTEDMESEIAGKRKAKEFIPRYKRKTGIRDVLYVQEPDHKSYQIVLDAYVTCSMSSKALAVLKQMVGAEYKPSTQAFVGLVEILVREHNYRDAAEVIMLMRSSLGEKGDISSVIRKNSMQFENLIIRLLAPSHETIEERDVRKVETAKEKAVADAISTRADLLNVPQGRAALELSKSATSSSDGQEEQSRRLLGVEVYREMIAAGCRPSEQAFRVVIRAHGKARDLVAAIKAWTTFRSFSTGSALPQPEPETVIALLECVRDCGRSQSARSVINLVEAERLSVGSDPNGHTTLLEVMAKFGFADAIRNHLIDMANAGVQFTPAMMKAVAIRLRESKDTAAERKVFEFVEDIFPEALAFAANEDY